MQNVIRKPVGLGMALTCTSRSSVEIIVDPDAGRETRAGAKLTGRHFRRRVDAELVSAAVPKAPLILVVGRFLDMFDQEIPSTAPGERRP